ncbi:S-layer homology domain-containing protein [Candidatus Gracilibacteria bacterium]|nr:S-layer homology domain-containing protein [Candidatus Gracilibacteria bacterium]
MKRYILFTIATIALLSPMVLFSARVNFFPDVHVADWFYPYVEEIREWGVINGNDDGTFAPERNINRAEFSKMLALYDQRVDEKIATSTQDVVSQIDNTPSVMHLEKFNDIPADCPSGWIEANYGINWKEGGANSYIRTCYTDQACQTMHLELFSELPPNCPQGWVEADFGEKWRQSGNKKFSRTCYICR